MQERNAITKVYFIFVSDIKAVTSTLNHKANSSNDFRLESEHPNQSAPSFNITPGFQDLTKDFSDPQDAKDDVAEDPNLLVRFDYIDFPSDELPLDVHYIENDFISKNNDTKETIIILKNDDNGNRIFLKTSAVLKNFNSTDLGDARSEEVLEEKKTTTPKTFVYSPTIPQTTTKKIKIDVTTKKYNNSEGESMAGMVFGLEVIAQ